MFSTVAWLTFTCTRVMGESVVNNMRVWVGGQYVCMMRFTLKVRPQKATLLQNSVCARLA